ncbi:hypothetical protein TNCV_2362841 [Trichonephila clavipes]|nr:hypothetical protein TNCV_2362841 [Trichonephila clavipes]
MDTQMFSRLGKDIQRGGNRITKRSLKCIRTCRNMDLSEPRLKRGRSQWIPSHCDIHGNEQADKLAEEASTMHPPCIPMPLRNAKRLLRDKLRQKRISILTDLAVGKSWSRLLDGQRRAQLSALPRVEGVACFRIIT